MALGGFDYKNMGVNIESLLNDIQFDHKFFGLFKTYTKYINFRLDYVIRASITRLPTTACHNTKNPAFNLNQNNILSFLNNINSSNTLNKLQNELKTLKTEVNSRRKDISTLAINEEGLRKNIKYLEEIISLKEDFIREIVNYTEIKCKAKEKFQKEYHRVNKKYNKVLNELDKLKKGTKMSSTENNRKRTDYIDKLNYGALRYEAKIKIMDDVIKIAGDSKEKLLQHQIILQTSKDRLQTFNDELNSILKRKQELTSSLLKDEKTIHHLEINLSNLGVLSNVEKSRIRTSSNIIENNDIRKDFLDLQCMRNEVLGTRPKRVLNPKSKKETSWSNEDIRKYLENDEAIDSIDYLIGLKSNELQNDDSNLLENIENSNESALFLKCLSNLSVNDVKHLLNHYFNKVIDLKESSRENDEIISKLDEMNGKQNQNIMTLNNSYQEFHLSVEKKFMTMKNYYQEKMNTLFQILQEDNSAITVLKMKQEMMTLKKRLNALEKSQLVKSKASLLVPEPRKNLDHPDTSKSESEAKSSAKVTFFKNKIKIQKKKI